MNAEQIAAWAREAGRVADHHRVRVSERACTLSGWPPFEVVIAYETPDGWHERVVHKRLALVTRVDVLAAWRGGDSCCGP